MGNCRGLAETAGVGKRVYRGRSDRCGFESRQLHEGDGARSIRAAGNGKPVTRYLEDELTMGWALLRKQMGPSGLGFEPSVFRPVRVALVR